MRTIKMKERQAEKRIDRVLRELFERMPANALYKAFRKKDIKVNGIRVKEDYIVKAGDLVEVYIVDEILDAKSKDPEAKTDQGFTVIYEDQNILIVNKAQGLQVHADREEKTDTLIDRVHYYLQEKGELRSRDNSSFLPALCHRLDRNTGGLVIIAKNAESEKILLDEIKERRIKKIYQCLIPGKLEETQAVLKHYLIKNEHISKVTIYDKPIKGSVEIITKYKVLSYKDNISRLEVELVTGRTHQIRAHLAYIDHPILGDGKYGQNAINRASGFKYQALWATKIEFSMQNMGMLSYLQGKVFEVRPEYK